MSITATCVHGEQSGPLCTLCSFTTVLPSESQGQMLVRSVHHTVWASDALTRYFVSIAVKMPTTATSWSSRQTCPILVRRDHTSSTYHTDSLHGHWEVKRRWLGFIRREELQKRDKEMIGTSWPSPTPKNSNFFPDNGPNVGPKCPPPPAKALRDNSRASPFMHKWTGVVYPYVWSKIVRTPAMG